MFNVRYSDKNWGSDLMNSQWNRNSEIHQFNVDGITDDSAEIQHLFCVGWVVEHDDSTVGMPFNAVMGMVNRNRTRRNEKIRPMKPFLSGSMGFFLPQVVRHLLISMFQEAPMMRP